jgi:DNA glycosylase AlkZ-like
LPPKTGARHALKPSDIARLRLNNRQLASPGARSPADVVKHLGAVQAQDYPAALWAIGLRVPGATRRDIEGAIAAKTLVRT